MKGCQPGQTHLALFRVRFALWAVALSLCLSQAHAEHGGLRDLRAAPWKTTIVRNVGSGVVQYTGDDTKYGDLAELVYGKLLAAGVVKPNESVLVKTVDIRLSLRRVKVDEAALQVIQPTANARPLVAYAMVSLLSSFSKDKAASAVLCVNYEGAYFLGNDARLFRFGGEGELAESINAAVLHLVASIRDGKVTSSPACEPGWEGGQPQ